VRGVTLQPIQDAGRVEQYDAGEHRLTVSELRRRIAEQSRVFASSDIVPVPCNPDTLAMGYALKVGGQVLPLTRFIDPKVLVEQGARGREIDVAVLQYPDGRVQAGPPLEIRVNGAGFFDYDAKYDGGAVFEIPAPLDPATTEVLQDRAIRAFHALDCRGLLRVDFFLSGEGAEPIVNEVNTFPGFTAASQFPQIWQRAGIEFPALLDILISGALVDSPRVASFGLPRPARAVDLV